MRSHAPSAGGPGPGSEGQAAAATAVRGPGGPGGGPGGRGFGGPGGSRDLGQMLERMPDLNLSELKPGDALIVASTTGSDPSTATAIAVLAGVEPLLTGPPSDRRLSGPWSLDVNIAP